MIRVLLLVIALIPFFLKGQKCTSSISASEVYIGDVFTVEYRAEGFNEFPEQRANSSYFPSKVLTTDSSERILDSTLIEIIRVRDSSITTDRGLIYSRRFDLIAWDSCALVLLGFEHRAQDSTFHFPPNYLNVTYYPLNQEADIRDIKEKFYDWDKASNAESAHNNNWLIYLIAGCVVFCIVCFYLYRRIKHRALEREQQTLEEKTLKEIEELKSEELWNCGEFKEHFVCFSHILRVYLSARYRISFLDKTTEQSNLLLNKLALEDSLKSTISNLLDHSDLVKFANSTMGDSLIFGLFDDLIAVVHETSPKSEEK